MNQKLLAQSLTFPDGTTTIIGPMGAGARIVHVGDLVSVLIPYFFFFSGTALLLMLILGGFSLLTGGSDPKKIEQGKQRITYAIMGFIIVFAAYWVVQIAGRIFGLKEFDIFK